MDMTNAFLIAVDGNSAPDAILGFFSDKDISERKVIYCPTNPEIKPEASELFSKILPMPIGILPLYSCLLPQPSNSQRNNAETPQASMQRDCIPQALKSIHSFAMPDLNAIIIVDDLSYLLKWYEKETIFSFANALCSDSILSDSKKCFFINNSQEQQVKDLKEDILMLMDMAA